MVIKVTIILPTTERKKYCQLNHEMPLIVEYISVSEILMLKKCIPESMKYGNCLIRELESILRNKTLPLTRLDMINASLFLSLSISFPVGNRLKILSKSCSCSLVFFISGLGWFQHEFFPFFIECREFSWPLGPNGDIADDLDKVLA